MIKEQHVIYVGEKVKEIDEYIANNYEDIEYDPLWHIVYEKLSVVREYAEMNNVPFYLYPDDMISKWREEDSSSYYEESSSSYYEDYEDSEYEDEDEDEETVESNN